MMQLFKSVLKFQTFDAFGDSLSLWDISACYSRLSEAIEVLITCHLLKALQTLFADIIS